MNNNRIKWIDYLKVFASIAVISIHYTADKVVNGNIDSMGWLVYVLYNSFSRFAVPIFVMVSGANFLKKKTSIKNIYSKYIFRLLISYFVWSFIYKIYYEKDGIVSIFLGHVHLWYIPMLIGIYLSLPILYKIVECKKTTFYFLGLSFIFIFLMPTVSALVTTYGSEVLINNYSIVDKFILKFRLNIFMGYNFYFILGFVLSTIQFNIKQRFSLYSLSFFASLMIFILTASLSIEQQKTNITFTNNLLIFTLSQSIGLFIWFRYNSVRFKVVDNIVIFLSRISYGSYLIHIIVLKEVVDRFKLYSISFNSLLMVPLVVIIVFSISMLISFILSKIPYLNKYIC